MGRYPGLTLRVLDDGVPAIGPGKARLIVLIEKTGSISAAAREMGMSYKRAWQLVDALNRSFAGPVVAASRGGPHGGGTQVTPLGRDIVARFHAMEDEASAAIASDLASIASLLRTSRKARKRR